MITGNGRKQRLWKVSRGAEGGKWSWGSVPEAGHVFNDLEDQEDLASGRQCVLGRGGSLCKVLGKIP